MASLTNQIIANIKKTNTNTTFNKNFLLSENVICIDTSHNRIGINKKDPQYSIDISGNSINDAIKVHNLHIDGSAIIQEMSCNIFQIEKFKINTADISNITFISLSGEKIDASSLIINDISTSNVFTKTLSCESLMTSNDINSNKINCNTITCISLNSVGISSENIDISIAKIKDISCNRINTRDISIINLDVVNFTKDKINFNNIKCKQLTSDTGFGISSENIDISNNIQCKKLITSHSISSEHIYVSNEISGNNIVFINADLNNITVSKLNTKDISSTIDISNGKFILPKYNTNKSLEIGSLAFDNSINTLKVYNNKWNNILLNNNYATLKLNKDISGNDISFNNQSFFIDNSNNLIFDISNPNYKYIPLKFDVSSGNKFDIINKSKTIEIKDGSTNEIFEIHANVGIKYLNKNPKDVEVNIYNFGIYKNMNTPQNSIDNSLVNINNTVIVFDNSYNYTNSSLNYIGPIIENSANGINFYINSDKDINYIIIDKFNATIKQLQIY